jgi:glycosyltransferase involved in cell wall biosynthesis
VERNRETERESLALRSYFHENLNALALIKDSVKMKNQLKISIITVCFNSEDTIEDTVRSVISQTYNNIEYIVVDGKSQDSTLSIIQNYKEDISVILSEEDKGLYDAMNKGIRLSTGDIVGTLNSDDVYFNKHVLSKIAKCYLDPLINCSYGDLVYVENVHQDKVVRRWVSSSFSYALLLKGWIPAHPTFYCRRELYEELGCYNTQYKLAADYDLLLRFFLSNKLKAYYIPEVLVKMRVGGVTNNKLINIVSQNVEIMRSRKNNLGKPAYLLYLVNKFVNKLNQYHLASRY